MKTALRTQIFAAAILLASLATTGFTPAPRADLSALDGEWIYVEDRTPGKTLEQMGAPMSSTFALKSEAGAVILVSGHGSGHKNVRVALDGTALRVPGSEGTVVEYTASWKEDTFSYRTGYLRGGSTEPKDHILRSMQVTKEGLLVTVTLDGRSTPSIALYKHPADIPMPKPAAAKITDIAWLAGNWVGTRGTNGAIGIEERWSPAKGGSMLAISRTISRDRLSAFEFLRILEKDGGLVYIAQPNGGVATEFIMTEFSATKAVFDNPRHDYPKRIIYELNAEGKLTATIGYAVGGSPRKFEFAKEKG